MTEIRIAVASHKPYWMPSDRMYVPVHAGAALSMQRIAGFRRDDEGDGGISVLNPHLSELTVLYWAWKNLSCYSGETGAVGLVHYRRHFAGSGERGVMTSTEVEKLLARAPVVVPRERNYVIETMGSHFDHTFDPAYLDMLVSTVAELSPASSSALYRRLTGTKGHMFNMFVMRGDLLDGYCSWLFPIVQRLEKEIDYAGLSSFDGRTPGRLSEFLLDTWLEVEGVSSVDVAVRDMEPVNWAKKGGGFLAAKFLGKRYAASF